MIPVASYVGKQWKIDRIAFQHARFSEDLQVPALFFLEQLLNALNQRLSSPLKDCGHRKYSKDLLENDNGVVDVHEF